MNFLAQLVNGIALGSGYALLAVGWTVLLGSARLVNFSHGQLYMIGATVIEREDAGWRRDGRRAPEHRVHLGVGIDARGASRALRTA